MNRSDGSRKQILDAASAAFVEGNGHFEMADVARRAGTSIGLAYHYFGSKTGLVSALVSDFYDRFDAIVLERTESDAPWRERELRRFSIAVQFLFTDPLATVIIGRLASGGETAAVETDRRNRIIEAGARNIANAQKNGEVHPDIDPEIASAVINGGLRHAAYMALTLRERPDADEFARRAWFPIARGLCL